MISLNIANLEATMKMPSGVYERMGALYISFNSPKYGRRREVLAPNGIPLKPTAENIRFAARYRDTVLQAIAAEGMGGPEFDYGKYFPASLFWMRRQKKGDGTLTMRELIENWVSATNAARAISTNRQIHAAMKEFVGLWGDIPVVDFTFSKVRDWIRSSQESGRTLKTIKNYLPALSGPLAQAVTDEIIPVNPLRKLEWSSFRPTRAERFERKKNLIDPFSMDEVQAILNVAGPYYAFVLFGVGCGARLNEILALAWEDCDLKRGVVHIRYGRVNLHFTDLKTAESDRKLYLSELPLALDALKRQRALTFMEAPQDCGVLGLRRHVFFNPVTGKPWDESRDFWRAWKNILRRAGVRYRYPYQMRHTFASLAVSSGEPVGWVADVMGHATTEMVIRNYARTWQRETAKTGGFAGGGKFAELWGSDAESKIA